MLPTLARKSRRRGQALVEGALTLLIFLMTLIAILDFGQILFFHLALTERVRDGVRRCITDATFTPSNCQNVVRFGNKAGTGTAFMGLTAAQVIVEQTGTGTYDERVTVRIHDFDMPLFSPYIARSLRNNTSFAATLPRE